MRKYLFVVILALMTVACNTNKKTYVVIETDYGDMKVELFDDTPIHRDNFVKLVKEGFYDDLLFHRVIQGFMIQGGDPDSRGAAPGQRLGSGGPGYQLQAEIGKPHIRGALAAARTGGPSNPEKKSSGSQFYIVQGKTVSDQNLNALEQQKGIKYNEAQRKIYTEEGGTPMLDMEYTVFGQVVEGMDVIDKIASVQTDPADRPVQDVRMKIRMAK